MLNQITAVTLLNIRTIPRRLGNSLVIVVGVAGVVGVVVSMFALLAGLSAVVSRSGRDDRAIVLRGGSNAELSSSLDHDAVLSILDARGVKRDPTGEAIASPEIVLILQRPLRDGHTGANLTLRGLGPKGLATRPELRLAEGRWFRPGLRELVVGRAAQVQFSGLGVGDHIVLGNNDWSVVGAFASGGDTRESEVLGDGDTVRSGFQRPALYQSVTVQLQSQAAFSEFAADLTTNPALSVEVRRERDYLALSTATLTKIIKAIAGMVGSVMAIGAVFGALNTMYSAVGARKVEIATLRAIGYGGIEIVVSVLLEAIVLALAGAGIGAALAWLLFDGRSAHALGGNFSQVVFYLTITPAVIMKGIMWALFIGLAGGLFPALRAIRLPVSEGLRSV